MPAKEKRERVSGCFLAIPGKLNFAGFINNHHNGYRMNVANSFAAEFGNRFIVLPNPVYGDWESSLYNFNRALSAAQKDSVLKSSLFSH